MPRQMTLLGCCVAVGMMDCLGSVAVACVPNHCQDFEDLILTPPPPRIVPGMTRQAVEKLLKEGSAWESAWRFSGGQYWATYSKAGVRVYYGPDNRVLGVGTPWDPTPAMGMNTFQSGDW